MKNVFIVNSGKKFGNAKGKLSKSFVDIAINTLKETGHNIEVTIIDEGYEPKEEVEKIVWANIVIFQIPAWWMSYPWIFKKYFDEVTAFGVGILFTDDGRTRADLTKKYGSGGLATNKYYMISTTWNAPLEAFTEKNQFFEGIGIDGVFFHFHKAMQFMGFKKLPTFLSSDIYKNPTIEQDFIDFKNHLIRYVK